MPAKSKMPPTKELYEMYQNGMSMDEIAKKYGVYPQSVRERFKRANLPIRGLSEAHKLGFKTGRKVKTGAATMAGPDHWAWKGGKERREYRNKVQKEKCEICESRQNLGIHHKDMNHYNNNPDNLQVLCVSCHMSLHKKAHWEAIKKGETPQKSNGPVGWER